MIPIIIWNPPKNFASFARCFPIAGIASISHTHRIIQLLHLAILSYFLNNIYILIFSLKMIFEFNKNISQPMKLLGVHVIGEIASEIIHIGVSALIMKADSNLFIDTCYNYPTLGELYKYATYDAMGKRANRIKSE